MPTSCNQLAITSASRSPSQAYDPATRAHSDGVTEPSLSAGVDPADLAAAEAAASDAVAAAGEPASSSGHNAERGGDESDPTHRSSLLVLTLGALGVVFGDIGTSPLYAVQTVFSIDNHAVKPTTSDVYGVVSLVFWSITLVVSVKYISFILRADNDGEGGILALAALFRKRLTSPRGIAVVLALGVLGASRFLGSRVEL